MKNYNDFVKNKLNEEAEFGGNKASKGIGGLFKNLLGGLLNDVKDELKKPIEELNKKLGNQKSIDDMAKTVNKYFYDHREKLVTSLEETKTLPGLVENVDDNIRAAYASLGSTIKNFGTDKFTFEELFKDSPERTKKLFSKDTKRFDKNVKQFSTDLVLSLGKPYKVTKEMLEKPKDVAQGEEQQDQIAQAQGKEPQGKTLSPEDFDKVKEAVRNWFDDTIYKNTKKKVEETAKEGGDKPKEQVDINVAIENIPVNVTKNKDSVKNMVNKLATSDKQTMMNVRDALGLTIKDTPL